MYRVQADLDYFQRGVLVRYIRIVANVSFETPSGWTEPRKAIIDTGGPISIIPRHVWQQIRYGLYSNAEVEIPVGGRSR